MKETTMRGTRAKAIKKFVGSVYSFYEQSRKYKELKKTKHKANIKNSIPKSLNLISKKIHTGESFEDFKSRRKVCNKKRREREKLRIST